MNLFSGHEQGGNVLDNRKLKNWDKISLRESFTSW